MMTIYWIVWAVIVSRRNGDVNKALFGLQFPVCYSHLQEFSAIGIILSPLSFDSSSGVLQVAPLLEGLDKSKYIAS